MLEEQQGGEGGVEEEIEELVLRYPIPHSATGLRADVFLSVRLPRLSRSKIKKIIEMGRCTLETGQTLRPSTRVSFGDVLVVRRAVRDVRDSPDTYGVLHEDDHLYVVDKPAGTPVHPTASYLRNTMVRLARKDRPDTPPRLCHRIDRETSGVLVMAKSLDDQRKIMRQFEDRKVQKSYLALVWGHPDPAEGVIDMPLRLSETSTIRMKMEVVLPTDHGEGLPSATRYETVATSRRFAIVSCHPKTGRQHQIRIHMEHIGHPLVGDKIYGPDESLFLEFIDTSLTDAMLEELLLPRQALHAAAITFRHPGTDEPITIESPLAPDIQALFDSDLDPVTGG